MQRGEISTGAWRARVSVLPGSELHLEMEMADVASGVDPPRACARETELVCDGPVRTLCLSVPLAIL